MCSLVLSASVRFDSPKQTASQSLHIIKQQYGESILSEARHLERTRIKYAKYTNHLRFSLRCHHNNLIPKDLRLKSRIKTIRSRQILDRASRQLLQERININHNRRNRLKISIDHQTQHLKSTLHPQHFEDLHSLHNKTYSREMAATKERHLKKHTTLSTQYQQKQVAELQNQIAIDKSKWVVNLSTKTLSLHEKDLLEKGLNFSVTPKNIPTKDIVAKVETVLKNLPIAEADNIRAKTSLVLQNASHNLSKKQRQALHSLKEDTEITILPADKSRATVILDKEDYIKKCNDHLDLTLNSRKTQQRE